MKRRVKKNRWKWFLRSGSIDHDVTTCTNEIDRITEKLQASLRENTKVRRLTTDEPFLAPFPCPDPEGYE